VNGQLPDYQHESDECLTALTTALTNIQTAARKLDTAPNADRITKNAIEVQLTELRNLLGSMIRRLDMMPTA
jgi:hypothetical protein